MPEEYCIRLGLCCGREGCRRRTLPPSCLFTGRRVYWGVVILVVLALRQRRTKGASFRKLKDLFGVTRLTVLRWMEYYRKEFPQSERWQRQRGMVDTRVREDDLPTGLLEHYIRNSAGEDDGVVGCLRFLATGRAAVVGAAAGRAP